MIESKIDDYVTYALEEKTFEEVLELYDLSPHEVFLLLYRNGLISDEILEGQCDSVYE